MACRWLMELENGRKMFESQGNRRYRPGMSWNRRRPGTFTGEIVLQSRLELRDPGGGYVPHFIQIDADLVVNQDVAHAADGIPVQLGKTAARICRYALGGLADHLDVPDDS